MSEKATPQNSGTTPDGAEASVTPSPADAVDGQLGEAGERTLKKLRDENKELRRQLKAFENPADAERDASESGDSPSDGASDSAADADGSHVATTDADVKPTPPRFQGTGDGGAARNSVKLDPQLSRADLSRMTPKQIEAARQKGQLRNLMSGRD